MKSIYNFRVKHNDGQTFDMHDHNLWIESFRILSPNAIRSLYQLRSAGARLKKSKKGVRRVRIRIQAESGNVVDYDNIKHQIYNIFFTDEPFEIVRDLTPDKKILVLQEGDYDIENITTSDGNFELYLTMLEPYLIGPTQTITLTTEYQIHEVIGQVATPWKSKTTFTVPQSQFVLESNTGLKIILNFEFIAGDVLEIDSLKRKVTLNGNDLATAISLETEWDKGELNQGYTTMKANHETELTYTGRYN